MPWSASTRSRREPFAEHADDRHAAADRGLVIDVDARRARPRRTLRPVLGEQRLVRGDDVLAARDRGEHRVLARRRAADQLAHDVDVGARDRRPRGRSSAVRDRPRRRASPCPDRGRRSRAPRAARRAAPRSRGVVLEQLDHAAADVAEPQQGDADGARHSALLYE